MCTALSWCGKHHYFGRNLDLEYDLQEQICITPRNYTSPLRHDHVLETKYAMIGTAVVSRDYPLYFDACNEAGLSMAGLNFPDLAVYHPIKENQANIPSFALIPWILSQCRTVSEAEHLLTGAWITNEAFSEDFPPTPLHWIVSDAQRSIVVESMADGLKIHQNDVGVLTNNPPFDFHLYHLASHRQLRPEPSDNGFSPSLTLPPYSNGMGAIGLPGDLSSPSRFVRAAFMKENSIGGTVEQDIAQFFHILDSVAMPRGSVILPDGRLEITQYSSCCDTVSGIYYYKTYDNSRVCCVDLHNTELNGTKLICYPMLRRADFFQQNETGGPL